jgi:hypothetical protein
MKKLKCSTFKHLYIILMIVDVKKIIAQSAIINGVELLFYYILMNNCVVELFFLLSGCWYADSLGNDRINIIGISHSI